MFTRPIIDFIISDPVMVSVIRLDPWSCWIQWIPDDPWLSLIMAKEKEVELITIRTACSANLPPPLPEKAPHSLPPRATTPHGAATQKAQDHACHH